MIGQRFGRLHVVAIVPRYKRTYWRCICDCGASAIVRGTCLRQGQSTSCGCRRFELGERRRTHGLSHTRAYKSWINMLERCLNPDNKDYRAYGGRGIKVCERWLDLGNFFDDMGEPPRGLTIERRNNDGNYEPSNCCWATRAEQLRNRRAAK